MKKWLSEYWEHCLSVAVPLVVVPAMVYAYSKITPAKNTVPYSNEMLFGAIVLFVLFFPLLFAVYRKIIIKKNEREVSYNEELFGKWIDVSYKRFAIPISLLVSFILLIAGGLIYWDSAYGQFDKDLRQVAGYGMSWLMVGNYLVLPSCVIEWSFLGALIYILQDMLRRYISFDLTPRFYFLSIVRLIMAISAAIVLYAVVQANDQLYDFSFSNGGILISKVELRGAGEKLNKIFWILPICFIAGMFPVQAIASIKTATTNWLSNKLSNLPGRFGKAFQEKKSYIDLSYLVPPEMAERFREEGIYSVQDFAYAETLDLARQLPYNIGKIIDFQDQAMLLCSIGIANLEEKEDGSISAFEILSKNGVSKFSDLYYLYQLSKNPDELNEIRTQIKSPILFKILSIKGEAIEKEIGREGKMNVRLAAFKVWYLSPIDIAKSFE